jgi:transketolase
MGNITDKEIKKLQLKANDIRQSIIKAVNKAGSGHPGGSLGMADIFTYLYFHALNHDPQKPDWEDRDRLVLSNGHIAPVLYSAMAHAGYFPVEKLETLRKFGSPLQGHPHREHLPGVETSSGPLGSGLSQAMGMALADRIDSGKKSNKFFYCLTGDGELNEGQNWEAILVGGKYKPHNLIAIVDRNNIQIDGYTEDVLGLNPLNDKFASFGWHVQEIDGHNFEAIDDAIQQAKAVFDSPSVIIANTIPGKGVGFMERLPKWHGNAPDDEQTKEALTDLKAIREKIEKE